MAIGYWNERTKKVIDIVLKQRSILTIREIAGELSVSTRTVYNELERANNWLEMKHLPAIRVIRGKVQPFSGEEQLSLEAAMQVEQSVDDYIFTPGDRAQIFVCQIILSTEPVYVEELMHACLVSRNTIFTDLQAVISRLYTWQLHLCYEKKTGYRIEGDPVRVRALFFLYFNRLEPLLSAGKLTFLHMEEITPCLEQIECIEKELKVSYVRSDMLALAAMMPVMRKGDKHLFFSDVSTRKVRDSEEYRLVNLHFPELTDMEKIYLTLHFLGGRLASYSKTGPEKENESIWEITRNLVMEFERKACMTFERKQELLNDLYRHIAASLYRYRFGIQIGNPMAEDVQREYPYIFDVMRDTVQYLEQQIGVQISDSEVSYLTLHFGAHLKHARHDPKELRILVVCMNGVATGNMISYELQRILPSAKIIGVVTAAKVVDPQNICDIIVTSVNLKAMIPVIVVNPVLNDFDRKNILNHPLIRSRFGFVDTDAVFRLVQKYVPQEKHAELKNDLEYFFRYQQEEKQPVLNPDVWKLTDFLTEDRILFLSCNGNTAGETSPPFKQMLPWKQALYTTAAPLLRRGSMDEHYVQCIIDRLVEAGPYMFATKDLILAHARPESGVKHLDLSIGIAPEGVLFDGGKRARVIFLLVVEDQNKHMGILRDIRRVLAKPYQIDELIGADSPAGVCKILRSRLANG